jgi:hypothetical protein
MSGTERLFAYGKGLLEKRLGLAIATLAGIEDGEHVEALCDVKVVGAQCLFVDRQRAFGERLGLAVAALGPIKPG